MTLDSPAWACPYRHVVAPSARRGLSGPTFGILRKVAGDREPQPARNAQNAAPPLAVLMGNVFRRRGPAP